MKEYNCPICKTEITEQAIFCEKRKQYVCRSCCDMCKKCKKLEDLKEEEQKKARELNALPEVLLCDKNTRDKYYRVYKLLEPREWELLYKKFKELIVTYDDVPVIKSELRCKLAALRMLIEGMEYGRS